MYQVGIPGRRKVMVVNDTNTDKRILELVQAPSLLCTTSTTSTTCNNFNCIKFSFVCQPPALTRTLPTLPSTDIDWTTSTTALKLNGSYIANPLKIFLSNTIPLWFCIWINFEYDSPYCLTPALSLWIHSLRNSRFFTLRSRQAYCHDFSRRRMATRKQRLALPRKPFDCRMTRLCWKKENGEGRCRMVSIRMYQLKSKANQRKSIHPQSLQPLVLQ